MSQQQAQASAFVPTAADLGLLSDIADGFSTVLHYDRLDDLRKRMRAAVLPPDDLALLRDGKRHEAQVLEESIGEHLRNSLMILETGFLAAAGRGTSPYALVTYRREEIAAIRRRIQQALELAESPVVIVGENLATFMQRIAEGAHV